MLFFSIDLKNFKQILAKMTGISDVTFLHSVATVS